MDSLIKYTEQNPNDKTASELLRLKDHFDKILESTGGKFRELHGSFLFDGKKYNYLISELERQKLLYNIAKQNSSCLEIGTNMGHSSLIMLLANHKMKITTIDIEKQLAEPATNYLKSFFKEAEINFLKFSSPEILNKIDEKFDFVLIDGDHSYFPVFREFASSLRLSNNKDLFKVIFDDLDMAPKLKKSINILKIEKFMDAKCDGGYSSYYEINTKKNLENFLRFFLFFSFNYFFNFFGYVKYYLKKIKILRKIKKTLLTN
jgi:predicted O-methyltransferase YrrM